MIIPDGRVISRCKYNGGRGMDEFLDKNIKFMGNQKNRSETLGFIDEVLKKSVELVDNIDLCVGLENLAKDHVIHIIDDDDSFALKFESSKDDDTFEIVIDKGSRTIYRSIEDQSHQARDDENMDFLDEV